MYIYRALYNTSNNFVQSQDGNSRITLYHLNKLEKKTTLADISSLLKDFVRVTD